MKKIDQTNILIANEAITGPEPVFNSSNLNTLKEDFQAGFNFYKHYMDAKAMVKPVLYWLNANGYSKDQQKTIKGNIHKINSAVISMILMFNRGIPSTRVDGMPKDFDVEGYIRMIKTELERYLVKKLTKKTKESKISPYDRIVDSVNKNIMVQLNVLLDEMILDSKLKLNYNLYSLLSEHNIPKNGLKIAIDWIEKQKQEVVEALEGTNLDSVEGYSHLNKSAKKRMIANFDYLLEQIEKYKLSITKTRKIRKKTVVPVFKKVSKVKFKTKDNEYQIKSVAPENIVGAKNLVVFNTKNRIVTYFVSSSSSGFDVKGTTLLNVDNSNSVSTKLRKPKETLLEIQKKNNVNKVLNVLTTKSSTPSNTRINSNMILLKVF
jgi:hypothetical protein